MIVLYLILALLAAFFAVILVRAARFKPKAEEAKTYEDIEFDRERAVSNLQQLVRCKTVSRKDHEGEDDAEFEKLIGLLPKLYPAVYSHCELTRFPDRGLLFAWKGRKTGAPAVLMAHYDVVPVEGQEWQKDPFSGVIEDGVLWGRGSLDTKVTFSGILTAADHLISSGFTPEHDIYMAFSGGEEVNGPGAAHIVDWFEAQGITPELVLDEGGAVVENVFPGVKASCGMIGIAEKGQVNIRYTVSSGGGHASAPAPVTPIDRLARAVIRLQEHPFRFHLTKPVADMFDTLGRHSSFLYRMIFSNLWCFSGLLNLICRKSGGELNALVRTTVAFTQMQGSAAHNVLPAEASMVSNLRLNPEDSVESAVEFVKKTIADEKIHLDTFMTMQPSRISRTDVPGYEIVKNAVEGTWRGCIASPYLMVQCSDSRHYGRISDRVYRFSAMHMTKEERGLIHGANERVTVEEIGHAAEFFIRIIRQC